MKLLGNKKEFKTTFFSGIKLLRVQNKVYVSFTKEGKPFFLSVPLSVNIQASEEKSISMSGNYFSERENSIIFFNIMQNINKKLVAYHIRKLRINGLGYRCSVDEDNKKLVLKLGHSHKVELEIPAYLKEVQATKRGVKFLSNDKILSGNYLHNIFCLRPADCYKKKGIIKQRMKIKMKPIKKK